MNSSTLAVLLLACITVTGCARTKKSELGLEPAEQPCEGPKRPAVVRVVTGAIGYDAPMAFVREPMLAWVVPLEVVEVESGTFEGTQLAAVVHSPTTFAIDLWGFGNSAQTQPAKLELSWRPEYCMYEITKMVQPEPIPPEPGEPFDLSPPNVWTE
jgi:hypothetical protein